MFSCRLPFYSCRVKCAKELTTQVDFTYNNYMRSQLIRRWKQKAFVVTLSGLFMVTVTFAVGAAFHQSRVHRWSDSDTSYLRGQKRNEVIVAVGETLILDVASPPRLQRLVINGTLIVDDSADTHLNVGEIQIAGTLQIGTRADPFRHKAVITLTGDHAASRMISVTGGALELHGKNQGMSWTHLVQNAEAGTTEITLEKSPGWTSGATIVFASTDFDAHQAETRRVTKVEGTTVALDTPLQYPH